MKILLYLVLPVLLFAACAEKKSVSLHKGANETEQNIYRSGDSMLAAFARKDWVTFVKYNHPAMTKIMGGPQAFASFISQQMNQIPDTAIKKIELGKILQILKTPQDQQCVVEQNMQIVMEGVDLSRTTYLVGESLDNGKSWTFLDASAKSGVTAKQLKPDISDELKIPVANNKQAE